MHTEEKIDFFSRPAKKKNKVKLVAAILIGTFSTCGYNKAEKYHNSKGSIHMYCISDQHAIDHVHNLCTIHINAISLWLWPNVQH